jgi:hypothetical protein
MEKESGQAERLELAFSTPERGTPRPYINTFVYAHTFMCFDAL